MNLAQQAIAEAYAALKPGLRRATYIGGGRIQVCPLKTSSCVARYVTTTEARAAIAKAAEMVRNGEIEVTA